MGHETTCFPFGEARFQTSNEPCRYLHVHAKVSQETLYHLSTLPIQTRGANLVKNLAVLRRVAQIIVAQDPDKISVKNKLMKFSCLIPYRNSTVGQWARSLAPPPPKRVYQAFHVLFLSLLTIFKALRPLPYGL